MLAAVSASAVMVAPTTGPMVPRTMPPIHDGTAVPEPKAATLSEETPAWSVSSGAMWGWAAKQAQSQGVDHERQIAGPRDLGSCVRGSRNDFFVHVKPCVAVVLSVSAPTSPAAAATEKVALVGVQPRPP